MLVQSQRIKIMCLHCAGDLKRCFHSGPCFFIQWRCAAIFHFFGKTCCNFPRFCIPHFFDQLSTQQCQSWHQCMVRERVTTLVFLSLHFASVPPQKRLGPRAPSTKHFRAAMADFRPCNFFFIRASIVSWPCLACFFVVWFARLLILPCFPEEPEKELSGIPVCRQNLWHWETVVVG